MIILKNINKTACKTALIALFAMATLATAWENGLARTPPMGWNSWNHFACEGIKEDLFKEMVDAMVSNGMKDVGYEYLNIDDCWAGPRDGIGDLTASSDFTNNSLKPLADYVHSQGLKIGTYGCAGTATCQGFAGSYNHEEQDAIVFAEWEMDYIKWDYCYTTDQEWWRPAPREEGVKRFTKFRDAIIAAGRPMLYSICSWGKIQSWEWAAPVGNIWRTTNDIELGWNHVKNIVEQQVDLWSYSKPGAYNDPDMLEVGRGMSELEDRTHFGMWCMFAAPLIMGNDLRNMTNQTINILTNSDAIAVDQDPLGIQAQRIWGSEGEAQLWVRPLQNNGRAIAFYNGSSSTQEMSFDMGDLNNDYWTGKGLTWTAGLSAPMREIWSATDMGEYTGQTVSRSVPSHGMAFITIIPTVSVEDKKLSSSNPMKINVQTSSINVTLPFEGAASTEVEVFNTNGELVTSISAANTSFNLSTKGYKNGVYILRANNKTQSSTALFTIQR